MRASTLLLIPVREDCQCLRMCSEPLCKRQKGRSEAIIIIITLQKESPHWGGARAHMDSREQLQALYWQG